ncbi:MAG: glycosyltransferase family 2 protein [Candidatus Pacebacteria bacterium]|nr:glycosyltransferase family 2 protein [Candidatus Paceibacterota bacterium]
MHIDWVQVFLYGVVFVSLYTQIFFLYSFFISRKQYKQDSLVSVDPKELPTVTLVVPCWNEEKTIDATFVSLDNVAYPQDKLFVIAVDDGSTDATWKELQKYAQRKNTILLQKENGGKHSALNLALDYVTTDLICSLDADTRLDSQSIQAIASVFVKNKKVSAVGGSVLIHNPATFAQKAQSIEYQMFAFTKKVLGLLGGVLVVPGAFSVFKIDALRAVGGYKRAHNLEDLELTYRLQIAGYEVDHCHNALVYTTGPASVSSLFRQRLRWGYGFLQNTRDYKKIIFNPKMGAFGMFTVPTSVFAYFVILSVFFISWYKIFDGLIHYFSTLQLVGFNSSWQAFVSLDWFFVNTQALSFLSLVIFASVLGTVFLGRYVSGIRKGSFVNFIPFFILYGLVVPFWVLRSVYDTLRASTPSWR